MYAGIVAAFFLTAQSPPATTDIDGQLARFESALTRVDQRAASDIVDELIIARTPADGQPRVDPLISSLLGRLFLHAHQEANALPYLSQATPEALPQSIRAETLLAYGRALELTGHRQEAIRVYGDALANSSGGRTEWPARLGIARQKIVSDPNAVRNELSGLLAAASPANRWEVEFLLSLASSLTGNQAAARQFANLAWSDAANAAPSDLAPLRVSVLRAGLANVAGDEPGQRAMLAAANAGAAAHGNDLARQLPVCDEDIRPGDTVTLGAVLGPYNTRAIIPIAASRPEIVAAFFDRLAGREAIKADDSSNATGTIFTLSCVSRVSSNYIADRMPTDPLFAWLLAKGMYPAVSSSKTETDGINRIADRIDDLTRRFGPHSPLLIGPRWQLLQSLESRRAYSGDVAPGRLTELRTTLIEDLRRAGAPASLAKLITLRGNLERLAQAAIAGTPDAAALAAVWNEVLREIPFTAARYLMRDAQSQFQGSIPPQQASMIAALLVRMPPDLRGPDREAFLQTMAWAQRSAGNKAEAFKTIASTALAPNACVRMEDPPQMLEQNFSPEDYPAGLIPAELRGYSMVEFDLSPGGKPTKPRTVVSLPSGLFDEVTAKGIATMRYSEPKLNGKSRACRFETQSVVWRLQGEDDVQAPTLLPDLTQGTT
jgi:hypothetical protein